MATRKEALAWLERNGTRAYRDAMVRFALPREKAFGVSVAKMQAYAKKLGRDHDLALDLWQSGWFEARMLATLIAEPARLTRAQMDAWSRDFDNWGITDTACFWLFDRSPHAWDKIEEWAKHSDEYVKRAAFALIWSLSTHDKAAPDARFLRGLKLIEREAVDERLYVKKAVNMALRATGKRNDALNKAALATARKLAASSSAAASWVGRDAMRELQSPSVAKRLAAKKAKKEKVTA